MVLWLLIDWVFKLYRKVVQVKNGTEFHYTLVSVEEQARRYTKALLGILNSPGMAKQMGEAGEARIKTEFSIGKIVQKFIRIVTDKKLQKAALVDGGGGVCQARQSSKLNEQGELHWIA